MHPGESIEDRNRRVFGIPRPVAVITGSAAARVGRCIAEHLKSQGFQTVLHAHHQDSEHPAGGAKGKDPVEGDLMLGGAVQDEATVAHWCEQVVERYQRVDVLINSAAIWDPLPLEKTTAEEFRKYFDVNALGTALCCKHFGLRMTQNESGGAIVNIGDWAIRRPYRDFAAYFPSKGAVETITHSMAIELAARNPKIRVNAILPGPVMLDDSIDESRRQRIISAALLRREGTPEDVAQAALFLVTSPFITGVCLPVDGGRSIYAGPSTEPVAHPDA